MIRSRAIRCVALIASAVASVSCGDFTGSTSPELTGPSRLGPPTKVVGAAFMLLGEDSRGRAVRWGSSHSVTDQRVSALIGPAGGTLTLPGADFTMMIPEGALAAPTVISISAVDGPHVAYDFEPHGLRFSKRVTVVQHLRNTASYGTRDGGLVRSAYLDDGNEQIGADDTAAPAELEASTTLFYGAVPVAETHVWYLNHFSRWILISGVWTLVEDARR